MKNIIVSLLLLSATIVSAQRQSEEYKFNIKKKNNYEYEKILEKYHSKQAELKKLDINSIPKFDKPDLAAEFEFIKTVDPNLGYVPANRLIKAREYAQSLLSTKSAIPDVRWQERGPNNVGGRTRALMFDPNDSESKKVWAGSVSGGLWTNTDITNQTVAWESVNDFWANIAISCITYDVNNTNIFYVGTGEGWSPKMQRGAGIWKTTDGGTNWTQISSTNNSQFYYVQKIVVTSTSRVIAATNGGLLISDDGGDVWEQKQMNFFADIEIAANGDIYASEGARIYGSGHIYKSTDNGNNWTEITPNGGNPDRIELACAPSESNVVYAVASNETIVEWIKKSVDGGNNWTDLMMPMYYDQNCSESSDDFTRGQSWYDLIMIVHPTNKDYVLVGGIDIHRTIDGGDSWEPVSYWTGACATYVHADQHAMVYRPGYNNEAIFGCDGGVFYSDDVGNNGTSFIERNKNYNVTQFYACASKNEAASNYFLAGAQDNGTHKFNQTGVNATSQATGGDGGYCFIDQDNPNIQITSYVYNVRWISTDGGNSFDYLTNDYTGGFICPADYDSDANILYSSYDVNQLMISNVGTGSYENIVTIDSLGGVEASNIKVSPYTNNVIFVGTNNGGIYKISNANTTPISVNIDVNRILPYGYISCIDIGENENHILLTYSNYGVISVWETTNGGDLWVSKEGNLPDMPIRWCLFNPSDYNTVLLATDLGIWSVSDLSATEPEWEPTVTDLANVRCDMIKHRTSDDLISVATYGRGLFTTDVFGSQIPIAQFNTSSEIACITDTIKFFDISTKNPTSWAWSFSPSTVTYVNGTDSTSQNPIVVFNNSGNYSVNLLVSNSTDSDYENKVNYISVNLDCEYAMINDIVYTCDAKFYDPGYTGDYPAGQDFVYTIFPTSAEAKVIVEFTNFFVEYDANCNYDWLKIYDATNSNTGFIGQFCGNNNPGTITATNPEGALTFVFHADGGVEEYGWIANITCYDEPSNINNLSIENNFQIYPNPTNSYLQVNFSSIELNRTIEIYDVYGRLVKIAKSESGNNGLKLDVSTFESGIYVIKIGSTSKRFVIL